jgi:O-methyltransferase
MIILSAGIKLQRLLRHAKSVADLPGAVAECGVFEGGSLLALAKTLPHKTIYGFDTFKGLPANHWLDGEPLPGGMACSLEQVQRNVRRAANIKLVPGILPESVLPYTDERWALVYLDLDYYASTRDCIAFFRQRMTLGGLIVFDDYDWKQTPGVRAAIEEAELPIESDGTPHQVYWRCAGHC